jgi:steroid 5-alpha reductase family enzyme
MSAAQGSSPAAWTLALLVLGLCSASALGAWVWQRRLRNAGVIDIVWGPNLGIAALVYAVLGGGWGPRRAAAAGMAMVSGARLSLHLARRVLGHPEEGRYVELRARWGAPSDAGAGGGAPAGADAADRADRAFLAFFLFQAVLTTLLSAPFLLASLNPAPGFGAAEAGGAVLWLAGFLGEAAADRQLARFKADPASRGRSCRDGLWRLSRHPNYFFEWLQWLGYWLFACASPWGWATLFAPALMLHFLLNVTGVKATEEQCLRSRGEDYARYRRETSMFVPLPPRRSAAP